MLDWTLGDAVPDGGPCLCPCYFGSLFIRFLPANLPPPAIRHRTLVTHLVTSYSFYIDVWKKNGTAHPLYVFICFIYILLFNLWRSTRRITGITKQVTILYLVFFSDTFQALIQYPDVVTAQAAKMVSAK